MDYGGGVSKREKKVLSSFAKCDARYHDCVGLPHEVDNTLDTLPKVIMGEVIFYAPIFLIPLFRSALVALYTFLKYIVHRYIFLLLHFPHRT